MGGEQRRKGSKKGKIFLREEVGSLIERQVSEAIARKSSLLDGAKKDKPVGICAEHPVFSGGEEAAHSGKGKNAAVIPIPEKEEAAEPEKSLDEINQEEVYARVLHWEVKSGRQLEPGDDPNMELNTPDFSESTR